MNVVVKNTLIKMMKIPWTYDKVLSLFKSLNEENRRLIMHAYFNLDFPKTNKIYATGIIIDGVAEEVKDPKDIYPEVPSCYGIITYDEDSDELEFNPISVADTLIFRY